MICILVVFVSISLASGGGIGQAISDWVSSWFQKKINEYIPTQSPVLCFREPCPNIGNGF